MLVHSARRSGTRFIPLNVFEGELALMLFSLPLGQRARSSLSPPVTYPQCTAAGHGALRPREEQKTAPLHPLHILMIFKALKPILRNAVRRRTTRPTLNTNYSNMWEEVGQQEQEAVSVSYRAAA
ncbi:uncharacterized [Tachysurus ichikawai]